MSFSTNFTITPLAGLFKHEPFSTSCRVYSHAAVINATMLNRSTTAITAYSHVAYLLHLGGVEQRVMEDLPSSSML